MCPLGGTGNFLIGIRKMLMALANLEVRVQAWHFHFRVHEQYNVRMVDKSAIGVGSEDLAH